MRTLTQALTLTSMATAVRSAFKIASVNPVLWWDAESHRAALAGGAATLFQDSAGTSAVTVVEQPVGRAIDQSGNARHALQATSTARPLLTARKNLLGFSEQFDNAYWQRVNDPTVLSNVAAAPDGTTTADSVQAVTGGAYRYVASAFIVVQPNATVTASIYVKKETSETAFGGISLDFQGGTRRLAYVGINAVAGTAANLPGGGLTPTISVVDAGAYWRLIVTVTDTGSNTAVSMLYYANLSIDNVSINGSGSASSPRVIWGAQLELGSLATAYQRIGPKKNLLTFTEQFDNAIWAKSVFTVAANTAIAPDGIQTADTITTGASSGYILQANAAANGSARSITGSLYIKNATGIGAQTVVINMSDGVVGGLRVVFNLAAGTFTLPGLPASWSNVTRTVTPVGDGWFRIVLSGTTAQWAGGWFEVIADNIGGAAFHLWGAQLEYGPSATGYERIDGASSAYDITSAPLMLRFDGVDDGVASSTFSAGTLPASADAYLVIWPDADEQDSVLVEDPSSSGSRYFGVRHPSQPIEQSADGTTTVAAAFTVNGSTVSGTTNPTRSQLFAATQTGVPVLLQVTNLNLSAWTQVGLGRYVGNGSGFGYKGRHGCLLITPAKSDATRTKIRKALAKAYQITGVV